MKWVKYSGLGLLAIVPWMLGYIFLPVDKIDFSCESHYEILNEFTVGESMRSYGRMNSNYNAKGSGVGSYVGTLMKTEQNGVSKSFNLHRVFDFTYEIIGSYVRVNTGKTSKYIGDNTPNSMAEEFVYRGFKSGETEYFQVLGMGTSGIASGIGGMPRIYCGVTPH